MSVRAPWGIVKRSVVNRVLLSYAIVVLALALVAGWSALALRRASNEANLMRSGYYPIALTVRDLVAYRNSYNAQLNHITSAQNPADLKMWFELAFRNVRPTIFNRARLDVQRAFDTGDPAGQRVAKELKAEVSAIERFFAADERALVDLFGTLDRGDARHAERQRDALVKRGAEGLSRLQRLESRVEQEVDNLLEQTRGRERLAIRLLVGLTAMSLLIGLAMALYARRVLRPLSAVTERAKSVAEGDLKPRAPIVSDDEIGELSSTFESMVLAIGHANEQLVASERLATIGKMAAHVTHEIRNPLSSIALNLEMLEEDLGPNGGESKPLLRAIGAEVERLSSLSEQYLSFARQRSSTLHEEDLGELVGEACEFVRRELAKSDVTLAVSVDDALRPLPVDEGQIKQALFNLLRNARDSMPQGGVIRVNVRGDSDGGGARVTIEDEGVGLSADVRSRLFEPFFTTKRHGTGLGLAITRQIVQAHGGSIDFSEREGRGTRVTLVLPRHTPLARAQAQAEAQDA